MGFFGSMIRKVGRFFEWMSDAATGRGVSKRLDEQGRLYDDVLIGLYSDVQELRRQVDELRGIDRNESAIVRSARVNPLAAAALVVSIIALLLAIIR